MVPSVESTVPRVIWTLWLQGWDQAPPLVRACLASWREQNPGWDLRALDGHDVAHLPGVSEVAELFPAAASDIARAHLLADHGGVWVDSTAFCVNPLDQWLPRLTETGFFVFAAPGYQRMISSWFIASEPASLPMLKWRAATESYWAARDEPDEYFWFHGLFGDLHNEDQEFRAAWEMTPRRSAAGPHYFSPYGVRLTGPMTRRARARLAARRDDLYKLTTRVESNTAHPHSPYTFFVSGSPHELRPSPAAASLDHVLFNTRSVAKRQVNHLREILAAR